MLIVFLELNLDASHQPHCKGEQELGSILPSWFCVLCCCPESRAQPGLDPLPGQLPRELLPTSRLQSIPKGCSDRFCQKKKAFQSVVVMCGDREGKGAGSEGKRHRISAKTGLLKYALHCVPRGEKALTGRIVSKEQPGGGSASTDKPLSVCAIENSGLCICKYSFKLLFSKPEINHPHV